ncbi:shikimate dehydrogenase [soil metagenome]
MQTPTETRPAPIPPPPAEIPTMYFIGVTTAKSSIMDVFPRWAAHLGLGECALVGVDFKLHDEPARYREMVRFIKDDPLSLGALVTTHKLDLLRACRDLFDALDPLADLMGEVSSISKRDGRLVGHAKDPITSGLALQAFLPAGYWGRTGADACLLGAGGSALALSHFLTLPDHGNDRPRRVIVTNRSQPRLDEMRAIHDGLGHGIPVEYYQVPDTADNDAVLDWLAPGSLVVNATGLGKDAPGSPLTDAARFPQDGYAWEFNYRGDLVFLDQARAQQSARSLTVEDGWTYFIHGWTGVIAEVFAADVPTSGPGFDALSRIAAATRS